MNDKETENSGLQDEIEIDLLSLLYTIRSSWYLIVTGLLLGILFALGYYIFCTVPHYASTSSIYLRGSSRAVSLEKLQINQELTSDYEIILKSYPNITNAIDDLGLEYSFQEVVSMISINNPSDSRILELTVTSTNPELSMNLSNSIVENGIERIKEIDSQEPYIVEKARVPSNRVGYTRTRVMFFGGIIGILISLGYIFIRFIVDDTIKSAEEVERKLQLPVLTVVSEDEVLFYYKNLKSAHHHRKNRGLRHGK